MPAAPYPRAVTETYRSPAGPSALARYVSTGRTPLFGLAAGLAGGALAALVLSVVYAYGTIYIPIVQVEFLLTMGFGAAIGGATAKIMHHLKVRSRSVTVVASVLLGGLGWALSWLPWLYGVYGRFEIPVSVLDVLDPFFVLGAISEVYDTGTWSIGRHGGDAVSGPLLGIVWVAEAALVIGFSAAVALAVSAERVFCEKCDSWCTVYPECATYRADLGEHLRTAIVERADFGALRDAARPEANEHWLALKLASCLGCAETHVVALDAVHQTVDRRGNPERHAKTLVPYHHVTRGQMAEIQDALRHR